MSVQVASLGDPNQAVSFRGPFTEQSISQLILRNRTLRHVAFKVKTNQPEFLAIHPVAVGVLQPNDKMSLQIVLEPNLNENAMLLLQSAYVDAPLATLDPVRLWRESILEPDGLDNSLVSDTYFNVVLEDGYLPSNAENMKTQIDLGTGDGSAPVAQITRIHQSMTATQQQSVDDVKCLIESLLTSALDSSPLSGAQSTIAVTPITDSKSSHLSLPASDHTDFLVLEEAGNRNGLRSIYDSQYATIFLLVAAALLGLILSLFVGR